MTPPVRHVLLDQPAKADRSFALESGQIMNSLQNSGSALRFGDDDPTVVSMGLTHVSGSLRVPGGTDGAFERAFLVDIGATDSMAPGSGLTSVGIHPVGRTSYKLADGSVHEYAFGLAQTR
jgi:hypothetical protein